MNNLLMDYQSDILILFKNHYKKMINKSTKLSFEEILSITLKDLNIPHANKAETSFLESWYENVHNQTYLNVLLIDDFTEIILHSHEKVQKLTLFGKETIELQNISDEDFQLSLEVLALKNNINWNFNEPFSSFGLNREGIPMRVTLVHFSTSANQRSKVFLRKIPLVRPHLGLFNLEEGAHALLHELIAKKYNILISGGTGSGKTTLMRSLIGLIPSEEHLIVLEDTYEILNQHPGQTSFLANKDQNNKSLKDYCAYSLRMSPDRLVVGEMRSTEVVPFLLAMNTGHKGLMSTIHASSGVDALLRISLLFSLFSETAGLSFALITKLVCKNIDYVVHLEHKKIIEISRVVGSDGETPFYEKLFSA